MSSFLSFLLEMFARFIDYICLCTFSRRISREVITISCCAKRVALQYRSKAQLNKPLLHTVLLRTLPVFNIQPPCRKRKEHGQLLSLVK